MSELVRDFIRQGLTSGKGGSVRDTVEALEWDVSRLKRQLVDA